MNVLKQQRSEGECLCCSPIEALLGLEHALPVLEYGLEATVQLEPVRDCIKLLPDRLQHRLLHAGHAMLRDLAWTTEATPVRR